MNWKALLAEPASTGGMKELSVAPRTGAINAFTPRLNLGMSPSPRRDGLGQMISVLIPEAKSLDALRWM